MSDRNKCTRGELNLPQRRRNTRDPSNNEQNATVALSPTNVDTAGGLALPDFKWDLDVPTSPFKVKTARSVSIGAPWRWKQERNKIFLNASEGLSYARASGEGVYVCGSPGTLSPLKVGIEGSCNCFGPQRL